MSVPAALLDVDGTLVDTNYHHALAWFRAFRALGEPLPLYVIHRHVGMGGDQLVPALAGDRFDREHGDAARSGHDERYKELIDDVRPLRGARELLDRLRERGHTIVLSSSAKQEELDHYLDLLGARELLDGWTTSDDVERTKPAPDLVGVALEKAGGGPAVLIGDTTWDCEAAARAGIPVVAVLTGGYGEQELADAGAARIFRDLPALLGALDDTPLRGRLGQHADGKPRDVRLHGPC